MRIADDAGTINVACEKTCMTDISLLSCCEAEELNELNCRALLPLQTQPQKWEQ